MLDASLTPTPAEPRNKAIPLKMLMPEGAGDAPATAKNIDHIVTEETPMSEDVQAAEESTPAANIVIDYDKIGQQINQAVDAKFVELEKEPARQEAAKSVNVIVPGKTREEKFKKFLMPKHYAEIKALEGGTDSEGGYIVPEEWAGELIKPLTDMSYLRAGGARVITVPSNSGDKVYFPTLTNSTAAVLTAEEAGYSEVDPSFGQINFVPYKYTKLTKVTEELANDSMFDIWGEVLAPDFANAFVLAENTAFTTGTGSSQPQGVVTGGTVGKTAASASAITADEVIDLYHALDYKYRPNAVWMMNDSTIATVRKLKDGNSQYLWQPGLAAGQPDTILGRPVMVNNSMATIAASAKTVLFGDLSYYWILDWEGVSVDVNPYLYMANGFVGYFARKRFDAKVALAAAIQVLQQAAS